MRVGEIVLPWSLSQSLPQSLLEPLPQSLHYSPSQSLPVVTTSALVALGNSESSPGHRISTMPLTKTTNYNDPREGDRSLQAVQQLSYAKPSTSYNKQKPSYAVERRLPSTNNPQPQQQETSPLLNLPPELRDQIYSHSLRLSTWDNRIELRTLPLPPLLCACRHILHEALSTYFAENYFVWTIRFRHRHRLEEAMVPPLKYTKEERVRDSTGPILDMRLDVSMPWATLQCESGQSEYERYRLNLATITCQTRASGRSWVCCSTAFPGNLVHLLQRWEPASGEPTIDEVLSGVVKLVWNYYKLLSCLGGQPSRMVWSRIIDKTTKSMNEQDRGWGRW